MSYNKIEIRYLGYPYTEKEHHKVVYLPKKVKEYGDRHGYSELRVKLLFDRLYIEYGSTTLMDTHIDINWANYMTDLISYEWQY